MELSTKYFEVIMTLQSEAFCTASPGCFI